MFNKHILSNIVLLLTLLGVFGSILSGVQIEAQAQETQYADEMDAAFATEWMRLVYGRVKEQGVNVPTAARVYSYTGITLYFATASGMAEPMPFDSVLNEIPEMPRMENTVYDLPSIANGAFSVVIPGLLQNATTTNTFNTAASNGTARAVAALSTDQATARRRAVGNERVERSLAYGAALGETILEWAEADGYGRTRTMPYTLPSLNNPSLWQITTEGQIPMEPFWVLLRTFVLPSPDACAMPLDVPFDTDLNSTFHMQAMEIRDMQVNLTEDQQQMAAFWDERPGESGTAAGHWVDVANQLVDYLDLNLEEAATLYGLLGVTFHDVFVSTWALKYQINLMRPETYITTYVDPSWQPYRQTPPFPAYPSGHSVLGGAVAAVLTELFGPIAYTDRYGVQYGLRARSYTSFEAAAYENAVSRMYAGVHYRMDIENGLAQGRCVGSYVIDRLMTS